MAVCAAALSVAPTAKNQSASIVNGRVRMPLEPLSCSPLGSNLEFAAVVLPSHGKLEYQARSGEWKVVAAGAAVYGDDGGADYYYTPEPGYTGSDFFTWNVSNGKYRLQYCRVFPYGCGRRSICSWKAGKINGSEYDSRCN